MLKNETATTEFSVVAVLGVRKTFDRCEGNGIRTIPPDFSAQRKNPFVFCVTARHFLQNQLKERKSLL